VAWIMPADRYVQGRMRFPSTEDLDRHTERGCRSMLAACYRLGFCRLNATRLTINDTTTWSVRR
jgi:hypothetical protein